MKTAKIHSYCECEAPLGAELDEGKHVLRGWAKEPGGRSVEVAPAHSIDADQAKFQVGWLCPFCVRNTLRSFDSAGLAWREAPPAPGSSGSGGPAAG
jgi:hypothetical protein